MKKIKFDTGVQEYALGAGVLRFNPGDPNLYARFLEGAKQLQSLEQALAGEAEAASDEGVLDLMQRADKKMKQILGGIFGPGNDFDTMLAGVNLLAVGANGEHLVTNLFTALEPVLMAGAENCAKATTQAAIRAAEARRSAQ